MRNPFIALLLFCSFAAKAQSDHLKYRRSSLYTIMLDEDRREHENVIRKTFLEFPIPDKFNDHNLETRKISVLPNKDHSSDINDFLLTNDIAKSLVAKWFNRDEKGCFNMNLVSQRGYYNASDIDVKTAMQSKRGTALLADAGEELIGNTFVLVSDLKFINKQDLSKEINNKVDRLSAVAHLAGTAGTLAGIGVTQIAKAGVRVAGKGYVVITTSYLYRLNWNDSIASVFYNNYWMDSKTYNEEKKKAFDKTWMFSLKFIGSEKAWADVQSTIYTKKSEDELVKIATINALDAVIAKLQKNHEEFRTSTPLYTTDPLSAKIGTKEGLEKGDKYAVLEQVIDEDGKTTYVEKGTIKVDGSQIWNNIYMAADSTQTIDRTLFKKVNGRDFYPGMLIKQK